MKQPNNRFSSSRKKGKKNIEKDKFDELLKELLVEKADVLKRLAKK